MDSSTAVAAEKVQRDAREQAAEVCIAKDFTIFSKLPAELRIKIWKEALPGPRYVDVGVRRSTENSEPEYRPHSLIAHLEVNVEARAVALKRYTVLSPDPERLSIKIYFDPTIDTIVFSHSFTRFRGRDGDLTSDITRFRGRYGDLTSDITRFLMKLTCHELSTIQRLAFLPVPMDYVFSLDHFVPGYRHEPPPLVKLENLKELIMIEVCTKLSWPYKTWSRMDAMEETHPRGGRYALHGRVLSECWHGPENIGIPFKPVMDLLKKRYPLWVKPKGVVMVPTADKEDANEEDAIEEDLNEEGAAEEDATEGD